MSEDFRRQPGDTAPQWSTVAPFRLALGGLWLLVYQPEGSEDWALDAPPLFCGYSLHVTHHRSARSLAVDAVQCRMEELLDQLGRVKP